MNKKRKGSLRGIAVLIWAICAGLGAAFFIIKYNQSWDMRDMFYFHIEMAAFVGIAIGSLIGIGVILIVKLVKKASPDSNMELSDSPDFAVSVTDEITRYKCLYDDGIITKEEFEAKKKQLLGLQ